MFSCYVDFFNKICYNISVSNGLTSRKVLSWPCTFASLRPTSRSSRSSIRPAPTRHSSSASRRPAISQTPRFSRRRPRLRPRPTSARRRQLGFVVSARTRSSSTRRSRPRWRPAGHSVPSGGSCLRASADARSRSWSASASASRHWWPKRLARSRSPRPWKRPRLRSRRPSSRSGSFAKGSTVSTDRVRTNTSRVVGVMPATLLF